VAKGGTNTAATGLHRGPGGFTILKLGLPTHGLIDAFPTIRKLIVPYAVQDVRGLVGAAEPSSRGSIARAKKAACLLIDDGEKGGVDYETVRLPITGGLTTRVGR
jgi:hypothetical protein